MTPASLLAEVRRRNPLLFTVGAAHAALCAALLAIAPFDHRLVMGVNPWIKPIKFSSSIALYLWTVGWYLAYVPGPGWSRRLIARGISVSMVVEIVCITMQAARGTTSHFNVHTTLDAVVFQTMGVMILLNTLLAVLLLVLFFVQPIDLPPGYLWALRLGIAIFVLGSLEGAVMIARNAHTVGAADGGPGLPLLNWSTRSGDLRAAHMWALHALQVVPLVGWMLSRWRSPAARQVAAVWGFAAAYAAVAAALFWQALQGRPLVGS